MWKQFAAGYFSFSKKDRVGSIAILCIIIIAAVFPFFYTYFSQKITHDHRAFEKEIASLRMKQVDSLRHSTAKSYDAEDYQNFREAGEKNYYSRQQVKAELFYFDPNTLDEAGWKKLGIRDKTITTIKNYVSKGGKFFKPEDIQRIWGLSDEEKKRLEPYIKIEAVAKETYTSTKAYEKPSTEKATYTNSVIDVNGADTSAFIALPGIGSKLSQRIITFREKLGGFYKLEQLGETFGLPDSTFQKIKPRLVLNNPAVRQINVNTATLDELKMHPYLRYTVANAIIQYRSQHGNFTALADLKKIMLVTEEIFAKAAPYLKIN